MQFRARAGASCTIDTCASSLILIVSTYAVQGHLYKGDARTFRTYGKADSGKTLPRCGYAWIACMSCFSIKRLMRAALLAENRILCLTG
jgi:hypothetical protein